VIGGVLVLGEASRLHDGGNNGVPEHHLYDGGGDGGEAEGAHLPLQRQVHVEVAGGKERAVRTGRGGGEGHEVGALHTRARSEREQLVGRAGLGERDEDVRGEQRADVAVKRVDGGEEASPRDASVCAVLRATIPDLPTPVKKTAPGASMSACANAAACDMSRRSKKWSKCRRCAPKSGARSDADTVGRCRPFAHSGVEGTGSEPMGGGTRAREGPGGLTNSACDSGRAELKMRRNTVHKFKKIKIRKNM
jgi:hypothetical protein